MDTYVVGVGPTELHAHIDLDQRVAEQAGRGVVPSVQVLAASGHDGQWSVVAVVRFESREIRP